MSVIHQYLALTLHIFASLPWTTWETESLLEIICRVNQSYYTFSRAMLRVHGFCFATCVLCGLKRCMICLCNKIFGCSSNPVIWENLWSVHFLESALVVERTWWKTQICIFCNFALKRKFLARVIRARWVLSMRFLACNAWFCIRINMPSSLTIYFPNFNVKLLNHMTIFCAEYLNSIYSSETAVR